MFKKGQKIKFDPYTSHEIDIIKKYYPIGGVNKVFELLPHRTKGAINVKACYLGVKKLYHGKDLDISDYENIISEKIAYTLGLIWGDGTIKTGKTNSGYVVSIDLQKGDLCDLINQNLFDDRWGNRIDNPTNNANNTIMSRICIYRKKLSNFLKQLDYENKSSFSPIKVLSLIPLELQHHFYRGWFDANGSFGSTKKRFLFATSITSSYDFNWQSLIVLCQKLNIEYFIDKIILDHGRHSHLEIRNYLDARRFMYYIYRDSQFKLNRKFDLYVKTLCSHHEKFLNFKQKGRGVYPKGKKFAVKCSNDNKEIFLGSFRNKQEAIGVYDAFKYKVTQNIFELNCPENYSFDKNYYLFKEQERIYNLYVSNG